MEIRSFEDLEIYKLSLELAKEVYLMTGTFPKEEKYGVIDQLRRASSSVGANIAEGFGRYHYKDKLVFMFHSRGSLYETRHFLNLAVEVGYMDGDVKNEFGRKIDLLAIKLNNYIASIKKQLNNNE